MGRPQKKMRWFLEQRLKFIDRRLSREGQINRSDLVSFFGVSVPQASSDLAEYQEQAKGNAVYDRTRKTYVAGKKFKPLFFEPTEAPTMHDDYPLGPTGQFPDGTLGPDDEGELQFALGHDKQRGNVVIQFNTPVSWLAFSPDEARQLAASLINHARALDGCGPTVEFPETGTEDPRP